MWHQLLLNYRAHSLQTCTDDEAGCVDYHEERIFSCNYFYQSYGPLFFSSNNILWHQLLIYFWTDFFLTCTHDQDGWVDDHKFFFSAAIFTTVMALCLFHLQTFVALSLSQFPATNFTRVMALCYYKCCCSSGGISVRGHILVLYCWVWLWIFICQYIYL